MFMEIHNVVNTVTYQVFFIQILITSWWQEKVGFMPMDELIYHPWQNLFTYSQEVSSKKLP